MIAVYPGSFDPVTYGHLDIIRRASRFVDMLVVAVLENQSKEPFFSISERKALLRTLTADYKNVEVRSFSGLLADFAAQNHINLIIRGMRDISDFNNELPMAYANRHAETGLETFFLPADEQHTFVSSHMIKEIWSYGGNIDHLTPPVVIEAMRNNRSRR